MISEYGVFSLHDKNIQYHTLSNITLNYSKLEFLSKLSQNKDISSCQTLVQIILKIPAGAIRQKNMKN